ncbi:hypothetical protein Q7C36_010959 [Tachysurus vachellii]|uniref:Taste receptor type 2 n=1 Tax=Tachysurus vachellii TaxID=175792 RepID=A0AA88MXA1_TACVA|nr:hypothetical protein Q7C36_010959 [Tachysurus vachellii]
MELICAAILNILCSALGFMINMFYVFCLVSGQTRKIRQPLLTLLVLMIFCTSLFQVSQILYISLDISAVSMELKYSMNIFMYYSIRVSMPTTLWLNIFYCTQIVPGRTALFTWFKRNIRIIVYLIFIFTNIYFLFNFFLQFLLNFNQTSNSTVESSDITTFDSSDVTTGARAQLSEILGKVDILTIVLIFLGLITMLTVNGATVCYLYKHIRKMTKSGKSINSQVLQNQVRVTITGLVQGPLYLLCTMGMFLDLYHIYYQYKCDQNILWTVFSVYSLSTTLNLGVGQSLFRQRITQLCRNGETSESDQTELS